MRYFLVIVFLLGLGGVLHAEDFGLDDGVVIHRGQFQSAKRYPSDIEETSVARKAMRTRGFHFDEGFSPDTTDYLGNGVFLHRSSQLYLGLIENKVLPLKLVDIPGAKIGNVLRTVPLNSEMYQYLGPGIFVDVNGQFLTIAMGDRDEREHFSWNGVPVREIFWKKHASLYNHDMHAELEDLPLTTDNGFKFYADHFFLDKDGFLFQVMPFKNVALAVRDESRNLQRRTLQGLTYLGENVFRDRQGYYRYVSRGRIMGIDLGAGRLAHEREFEYFGNGVFRNKEDQLFYQATALYSRSDEVIPIRRPGLMLMRKLEFAHPVNSQEVLSEVSVRYLGRGFFVSNDHLARVWHVAPADTVEYGERSPAQIMANVSLADLEALKIDNGLCPRFF